MTSDRLEGRWVRLASVQPADLPYMYEVATHPDVAGGMALGGAVPPFEHYQRMAYESVYAQWIVRNRASSRRIGVVVLASMDARNGTAFLSVMADPQMVHQGLVMDGLAVAIDHVFFTLPLRHLYMEMTEDNLRQVSGAIESFAETEGIRREAVYQAGRFQDVHLLAIRRQRWLELAPRGAIELYPSLASSRAPAVGSEVDFLVSLSEALELAQVPAPDDDLWEDLGLDSLDVVRAIVWLEESFRVRFEDDIPELRTVRDLYQLALVAAG